MRTLAVTAALGALSVSGGTLTVAAALGTLCVCARRGRGGRLSRFRGLDLLGRALGRGFRFGLGGSGFFGFRRFFGSGSFRLGAIPDRDLLRRFFRSLSFSAGRSLHFRRGRLGRRGLGLCLRLGLCRLFCRGGGFGLLRRLFGGFHLGLRLDFSRRIRRGHDFGCTLHRCILRRRTLGGRILRRRSLGRRGFGRRARSCGSFVFRSLDGPFLLHHGLGDTLDPGHEIAGGVLVLQGGPDSVGLLFGKGAVGRAAAAAGFGQLIDDDLAFDFQLFSQLEYFYLCQKNHSLLPARPGAGVLMDLCH